ncbi:MAG TPA: hypothetical protein VF286_12630 [Acidiphilium sp.]
MSDVIGPDTFNGVVLFLLCSVLAIGFGIVFLAGLLRQRETLIRPAWPVCLVNGLLAYFLFYGLDAGTFLGMNFDPDVLFLPWLALCGVVYWLLRRRALRERGRDDYDRI